MGLFFRKRLGVGPLNLNLSKSGLGLSTGARGFRVGLTSHGKVFQSASLPGTGLYYRRYLNHHHANEPRGFRFGFGLGVILVPVLLLILLAVSLK